MTVTQTRAPIEEARALLDRINPGPQFSSALLHALLDRMGKEWLGPTKFARLVGVHPNTVRTWVNEGRVRYRLTPSGRSEVHVSEVERVYSYPGCPPPISPPQQGEHTSSRAPATTAVGGSVGTRPPETPTRPTPLPRQHREAPHP